MSNMEPKLWILIPARGGSVGIPRKNLRLLAGKPLILHAIDNAKAISPRENIVVVTDDREIARVGTNSGVTTILETIRTPPDEVLDEKVLRTIPALRRMGAHDDDILLTMQPTSPLIRPSSLRRAVDLFRHDGATSVVSVVDDRHLRWVRGSAGELIPEYEQRVNRQSLPEAYRETGGIIAARIGAIVAHGTRVISPVTPLVLGPAESIDIDGYPDLYAAAHMLTRQRIAIRVDASQRLGMGHVYRMLALAAELARHEIVFYLDSDHALGHEFFGRHPYRTIQIGGWDGFAEALRDFLPDIVFLDVLDTQVPEILRLRQSAPGARIVSFEDSGPGSEYVDLMVGEFVDNPRLPESRKLTGISNALLSPAFELEELARDGFASEVTHVLVLFGGTDPGNLARMAVSSLGRCGFRGRVTVVRGLGANPFEEVPSPLPYELEILTDVQDMPTLMADADIAYTSAGRTIIELVAMGCPSICIAQNEKELTHTHATAENGVLMLGLGAALTGEVLDMATDLFLTDSELRSSFHASARDAGDRRRNRRTVSEILAKLGFRDVFQL